MNLVLNRDLRDYQVKLHSRATHLKQVEASEGRGAQRGGQDRQDPA